MEQRQQSNANSKQKKSEGSIAVKHEQQQLQMDSVEYVREHKPTRESQNESTKSNGENASDIDIGSIGENLNPSKQIAKRCMFFANGTCRNGDQCRFIHSFDPIAKSNSATNLYNSDNINEFRRSGSTGNLQSMPGMLPPDHPPPIIINVPLGQPIYSIDVECVATGIQHNARSVAQVALVDEWSRPIFNVFVKQDVPVVSYIHELTGLTKEILDEYGLPMAEAMAHLRAHLSPNALLVGQSIQKDVQWLQLAEGVDYASLIDLSGLLRVWNPQRREYTSFSQDHCAKVWIGVNERKKHDAMTDAAISMSLFNTYRMIQWDPIRLYQMQQATLAAPRVPGFSSLHPVIDGCCMGNRKRCICGASFDS